MGQNINKIKNRMSSITGAYKVTSAMKLVSSVKLKTWRYRMLANKEYTESINEAAGQVFKYVDNVKSPLLEINEKAEKNLYVIVSSSLGLCGSYNTNVYKLADETVNPNDEAIVLGKKGFVHYKNGEFKVLDQFTDFTSARDRGSIRRIVHFLVDEYTKGEYKQIHLIYTSYKNPIMFVPKDEVFLPLSLNRDEAYVGYPPLLEPTKQKLFETLAPFYLENKLYSYLLESEVCEQAARSNAMENATKNAEELLDQLQIEFAKARQGAITQELIEIVGAAESL